MKGQAAPAPEWPQDALFSVGHSTQSAADFLALLQAYGIALIADIRSVPRSRRNPQFNFDSLAASLRAAGIDYLHLPTLGGLRHARKDSPNGGWRNASFRGYADYMQTAAFGEALETLIALGRRRRVAMMCAEAVPWRCHRSLVADALAARGVPVVEILSARNWRLHKMTPFARIEGLRVSYPPGEAATDDAVAQAAEAAQRPD